MSIRASSAPAEPRGRSACNDKPEALEERFEGYGLVEFRHAPERHPDRFPEAALRRLLSPSAIDGRLRKKPVIPAKAGIQRLS